MITFMDYEDEDNNIDWSAFRRAQIACGEICKTCEGFANIINAPGYPTWCTDCKTAARDDKEVRHEVRIRCPYCRTSIDAWEACEHYRNGQESIDVTCHSCDKDFEVEIDVKYTFTSPAMKTPTSCEQESAL